jgi:acyl-CoA thioesterase FadM
VTGYRRSSPTRWNDNDVYGHLDTTVYCEARVLVDRHARRPVQLREALRSAFSEQPTVAA